MEFLKHLCTRINDIYQLYKNNVYNMIIFPYRYIMYEYFCDDHNIVKYNRTKSILTYRYNENTYNILINHSHIPNNVLCVTNHNDEDITSEFNKILGPGYDFHNIEYTPKFFKAYFIKVVYIDDTFKTIFENDVIVI